MIYPHCDSRILHAPGECIYCDECAEAQQLRIKNGVCFTGWGPHQMTTVFGNKRWERCPADIARPGESYNRWYGNVAQPAGSAEVDNLFVAYLNEHEDEERWELEHVVPAQRKGFWEWLCSVFRR